MGDSSKSKKQPPLDGGELQISGSGQSGGEPFQEGIEQPDIPTYRNPEPAFPPAQRPRVDAEEPGGCLLGQAAGRPIGHQLFGQGLAGGEGQVAEEAGERRDEPECRARPVDSQLVTVQASATSCSATSRWRSLRSSRRRRRCSPRVRSVAG